MRKQAYIRININDLTKACIALGDCQVAAAGSLYATFWFEDWEAECERLTKANISWCFD